MIIGPFVGREVSDFCTKIPLRFRATKMLRSLSSDALWSRKPMILKYVTREGRRGNPLWTIKTGFISAKLAYPARHEGIAI
jgi:hypothetical protein